MSVFTFKMFKGGKSKARKGLERFAPGTPDTVLQQLDGEWGFYIDDDGAVIDVTPDEAARGDAFNAVGTQADLPTGSESMTETKSEETDSGEEDEPEAPVASGNMFGAIAATLEVVAVTKPEPAARTGATRSNYTIEKDRPEQNGIKRPSAGGLCRAVWDAMDAIRVASGLVPTTQQVRDTATANGWNTNNAMIEFYQWRRYNGIVGRAPKVVTVVATPVAEQSAPVEPVVTSTEPELQAA